ncbi:MAG: outer membrane protein assembly factor BamB family protein, partial [Planctomycetota bacterium]
MKQLEGLLVAAVLALLCSAGMTDEQSGPVLADNSLELPIRAGVEAWVGVPDGWTAESLIKHCQSGNCLIYMQVQNEQVATEIREAAMARDLLGKRIFVSRRGPERIGIGDGLCLDCRVANSIANVVPESEVLRVLIRGADGHIGDRIVTAPRLVGTDVWSHPSHGPDNNPCSRDRLAQGSFETRYIAFPHFSPMPQISVAGYGRLYRAMGHIAHKANQIPALNTLVGVDIASGCILWRRSLPEGFMIHRNTWVAAPEGVWVGDNTACRLLDRDTGMELRRIEVPEHIGGAVWKWMGLVDETLYALVGDEEIAPSTQRGDSDALGHWGWSMWEGHDYPDPKRNFAFGDVVCAFDSDSGRPKWRHKEESPIDGRAICMTGDRLFYFCPGRHLVCLDAADGSLMWSNSDADLLDAIGEDAPAQSFLNGYSTQFYLACDDERLYFAGPQRPNFIAVRQSDGKMLWKRPDGVRHVVAHPQGVFVVTDIRNKIKSGRIDTSNGELLEELYPRRGCTRVTGSFDSLFLRARNGTIRQLLDGERSVNNIAPMRPPCHSGVIISDGMLFWGPWMCGCNLSFYGHVGLAPKSNRPEPGRRLEK